MVLSCARSKAKIKKVWTVGIKLSDLEFRTSGEKVVSFGVHTVTLRKRKHIYLCLMRARVVSEDVVNVDVEKPADKNRNDDYVDSAMKKKKSVSSTYSYSISSMMTKNPWVLLVLGIVFGAFLPTLVKHESARGVHKHVKGAYTAHREASKEYLKRYRETYLGEVKTNYVSEKENELLLESMVKEEEKKLEEALVEEEAGTVVPEDKKGEGETTFKTLENDNGEDTNVAATDNRDSRNNDDSGDGNTNIKLADIPFPSPEDAEFRFHETSSGVRTCLPGVPAEYSDVLTADSVTGSTISPDECLWLNDVKRAGIAASKLPSDCVPDKTVYSSHANEYHWEMLMFNLQNLKDRECFMNRLVIECMDDKALELCKASGYIKHCVPYPKAMRASDFERPEGQTESKSDYNALTWIKEKVAFSLMHADLSVFMFDSDVLFFDVPDLVEIQASKPDGIIFFQLASIEDEEVEKAGELTKEYHSHQDINTGQLLWKPSKDMKRVLLKAFRAGNENARIDALDQVYFGRILRSEDDGALWWEKAHHLSSKFDSGCFHHRPYDEEKKLKRTTFHACCLSTLSQKLQGLKTAQDYFLEHKKQREQMLSEQ
jgi:hypothetical protein